MTNSGQDKNLAIIGASYLQLPLIEKARDMGYATHVFAWGTGDVGETAADHFYPISIIEKERIMETCRTIGICGICSIASDLATVTVNYVAHNLGLIGNSLECTAKSTNKHLMRQSFRKSGVPSPNSVLVSDVHDGVEHALQYPVIVKPTDRSGSRGICKVESSKDLRKAIEEAIEESFEKKALIEDYVEGDEYSVEFISVKGVHYFLALTKKYTTGSPHFIETGHREPADVDDGILDEVKSITKKALDALGVLNGASHTELKIDSEGNIAVIEVGARMGGDCIGSDLVYCSTGVDFVAAVIQVACGFEPDLSPSHEPQAVRCVFITNEADFASYQMVKQTRPQSIYREVFMNPELLGAMTDSSNRAGCYIVYE